MENFIFCAMSKFDACYLNQVFNVDLENLVSFNLAPDENRITNLF